MNTANNAPRATPLMNPVAWAGVCFTLFPLMLWSSVSITMLTHSMGVPWEIAWIPAAATDGAMLVATSWAVNRRLADRIRHYATFVAVTGIVGSVIVAGIEHYIKAANIQPPSELAALIGGIPSLMGALIVHVIAMILQQQRQDQEELESELVNLDTAKGVRKAIEAENTAAAAARQEGHQKQLTDERNHRQELHDAKIADLERKATQLQQAEVDAATRSQHGLRQECDKVAALQAELDEALEAAKVTKEETDILLGEAEENRERAGRLRSEADEDLAAADEARKEAERIRSRLRRRNNTTPDATVSQPVSQPSSQRDATVSQPPSQTASRAERVDWAVEQLRAGEDLRPCDIDNKFGPPRNGSAVLKSATERFRAEVDGEWRVISSNAGGQ